MSFEADAIREAVSLPAWASCPVCEAPLPRSDYVEHVVGCRKLEMRHVAAALETVSKRRMLCPFCVSDRRLYPDCGHCGNTGWVGS